MARKKYICDCDNTHTDVVERVKAQMKDVEEYMILTKFFKVFADETRIKILWALDVSELCVCDICDVLGMTKSAVSYQLSRLRKAHLVRYRREGKEVYYSLDDDHVRGIFELGIEHTRHTNKEGKNEEDI